MLSNDLLQPERKIAECNPWAGVDSGIKEFLKRAGAGEPWEWMAGIVEASFQGGPGQAPVEDFSNFTQ